MTNAEKYLKDEVDLEEFSKSIMTWYFGNYAKANDFARIKNWAEHKIETLTEDERIILRNIDKRYKYVGRTDYDAKIQYLYVNIEDGWKPHTMEEFGHLFQFIKERRRILNRGAAKMSYKEKSNEIIEKYYKQQDFQYTPLIILLEHYKEFTPTERAELFSDIIPDIVYVFKSMEKNEKLLMQKAESYKVEYEGMCNILNKLATQGAAWYKEMEKTKELLK